MSKLFAKDAYTKNNSLHYFIYYCSIVKFIKRYQVLGPGQAGTLVNISLIDKYIMIHVWITLDLS